ncbi:lipopolysaccharide biosynthesis protein [Candidatus Omnitrophota bacterium]
MSKKRDIIKNTLKFSSSRYFSQFLGFFTATFMRRFLGPYSMGVWSILRVVLDYARYTHLGVLNALPYKIPYFIGRGELDESEVMKDITFSFLAVSSLLSGIAIAAFAILRKSSLSSDIFMGLLVVSALIIVQRIYNLYVMLLRAHKNFGVLSKAIAFDAVINLLLVLIIVRRFNLNGLFFVVLLMPVLNTIYIHINAKYSFKFRFNKAKLGSYIKFGLPLFIQTFMVMILANIDRIFIARMLGLRQLGYYSIAIMARSYNIGIANNFSIVLIPHFMEGFGKNQDIKKVAKYVTVPTLGMAYFMILMLGMVFIAAPPFVTYILPRFTPGIMAMKIFLITTFFGAISPNSENCIVALGKQVRLIPIALVALVVNIILNYVFIKTGYGINGVAVATAIAAFISFIMILIYAMTQFETATGIIKFILKILIPLIYGAGILIGLDSIIYIYSPIVSAFIKMALFTAAFIPVIAYLNKKTGIVSDLMAVILKKNKEKI